MARLRKQATPPGKTPLIVLLVTPSHIKLLKNDAVLVPEIVRKAFHSHDIGQEFHVLAAVVDRVTHTKSNLPESSNFMKEPQLDGDEGISVCILESETGAPDLWARKQPGAKETMSIQQRSTISFLLQPHHEIVEARINEMPPQPVTSRLIQLPVANTLFCNGKTSTILAQRWVVTSTQDSGPELRLTEESSLPQQLLCMAGLFDSPFQPAEYVLSVPLNPITPPRVVGAVMGNIVRTIHIGEISNNSVPASTELETAVARVSQALKFQGEIVGIWALVTPRENRNTQPYARPARLHQHAIDFGSRLHKVLSGGGGWGNKQGLLALDPDSEYSKDIEALQEDFGDGEDLEAEKLEALGQVVKPGDVVSFWAYISRNAEKKSVPPIQRPRPWKVTSPPSVVFGTVPSTVDLVPSSDATSAKDTAALSYTLIMNHFGMFSEQGLSMKVSTIGPKDQSGLGTESVGSVVQTKLDIPYSRISIVAKGSQDLQPVLAEKPGSLFKKKAKSDKSIEVSDSIRPRTRSFRKISFDPKDQVQDSSTTNDLAASLLHDLRQERGTREI